MQTAKHGLREVSNERHVRGSVLQISTGRITGVLTEVWSGGQMATPVGTGPKANKQCHTETASYTPLCFNLYTLHHDKRDKAKGKKG